MKLIDGGKIPDLKIILPTAAAFCLLFFNLGCGPNQAVLNSKREVDTPPAVTVEKTPVSFESDLEAIRANFDYVYVFRRKDGGRLDSDDRKFMRALMPIETNRRRLTDDEKTVIVGSKNAFLPEKLMALANRFVVENHSKPESVILQEKANSNS